MLEQMVEGYEAELIDRGKSHKHFGAPPEASRKSTGFIEILFLICVVFALIARIGSDKERLPSGVEKNGQRFQIKLAAPSPHKLLLAN
jgi:hypothetical protein